MKLGLFRFASVGQAGAKPVYDKKRYIIEDSVIADVYNRMRVKALGMGFIKEIATGMVTEAEISTRIGTARRKGIEEGRNQVRKETAATIASLQAESKAKDDEIAAKDDELAAKDAKLAAKDDEIASRDAEIARLKAEITAAKQH